MSVSSTSGFVVNDAAAASPSAHTHHATGCRSRGQPGRAHPTRSSGAAGSPTPACRRLSGRAAAPRTPPSRASIEVSTSRMPGTTQTGRALGLDRLGAGQVGVVGAPPRPRRRPGGRPATVDSRLGLAWRPWRRPPWRRRGTQPSTRWPPGPPVWAEALASVLGCESSESSTTVGRRSRGDRRSVASCASDGALLLGLFAPAGATVAAAVGQVRRPGRRRRCCCRRRCRRCCRLLAAVRRCRRCGRRGRLGRWRWLRGRRGLGRIFGRRHRHGRLGGRGVPSRLRRGGARCRRCRRGRRSDGGECPRPPSRPRPAATRPPGRRPGRAASRYDASGQRPPRACLTPSS